MRVPFCIVELFSPVYAHCPILSAGVQVAILFCMDTAQSKSSVAALLPIMGVVFIAFLIIGLAMPVLPLHVHQGLGRSTFAERRNDEKRSAHRYSSIALRSLHRDERKPI